MATPSRFADLSRQQIADLVEEKDSKNTLSATKNASSTLRAFCGEKTKILSKFWKKN